MATTSPSHSRAARAALRIMLPALAVVLVMVGLVAAPTTAAAGGPPRAVLSMPFDGSWANTTHATAPWEHSRTSRDDWAMDIYAVDTPVRVGIVEATGPVTLTVTDVDHDVGSCGPQGGSFVVVSIAVSGQSVGWAGYYHLDRVTVSEGQRISPATVIGRTVARPGDNSGHCWHVSTPSGIHTHFSIAGEPGTACYVRYAKGERLQSNAPLAVLGVGDDGAPVATADRQECRSVAASATAAITRLEPQTPVRVFDTRSDGGRVRGGYEIERDVVPGDDPDVIAVALNVTAVDPTRQGYVTVYPADSRRPLASSLNVDQGRTAAGFVIVPVGPGGRLRFYTSGGTHLVADLVGVFRESGASKAGRTVTVTPSRLLDTRQRSRLDGGDTVRVQVTGRGGVPTTGVQAAVVNLTVTDPVADGFVTAYEAGTPRPGTSNLNPAYAGQKAANLAIVPVNTHGKIEVFTRNATHLVVDVTGYVTSSGASASESGLFVPRAPIRAFDTRTSASPSGRLPDGGRLDVSLARVGVPDDATGAFVNVTAVDVGGVGYVTAWPTGENRPLASTLNVNYAGDIRPNAAILPLGSGASLALFTSADGHLLADVAGWFL